MSTAQPVADHSVVAFNTATASTNKIHDDAVAQQYGFRGGLVPGVDVYAYLTHVPVREWGRAWLERGSIAARFVTPVYDGRTVRVAAARSGDELELGVLDGTTTCATARAGRRPVPVARPAPGVAELPTDPPPASPASLAAGTVLGTVVDIFDAAGHGAYLDDARETLPLYRDEGIAHPGWVLRFANSVLARNVVLGPWIHVASDVALLGVVPDGATVEARAVVLEEFERKGHRFVTLDVSIAADGRPVHRVEHTAIYQARRRPA
jgi:acyl dehydratase